MLELVRLAVGELLQAGQSFLTLTLVDEERVQTLTPPVAVVGIPNLELFTQQLCRLEIPLSGPYRRQITRRGDEEIVQVAARRTSSFRQIRDARDKALVDGDGFFQFTVRFVPARLHDPIVVAAGDIREA